MNKSARKLKSLLYITVSGYAVSGAISLYRGDENLYKNFLMPLVHTIDAEKAHKLAIFASKHRLIPKSHYVDEEPLKVNIFGKTFSNPIGIAAGFDKDGEAVLGLKDIGFGFVEIGSITPEPQPGNEKPRVFRLIEDQAVINRYGFNSKGHDDVFQRIQSLSEEERKSIILGINLGKNKNSTDSIGDYVEGIKRFGPVADYLVINISSPNTPGLRDMQEKKQLRELLSALVETRNQLKLDQKPSLLLKLAPDLSSEERKNIAGVLNEKRCRVDGLIVSNTTIDRPKTLLSENKQEIGGLSGEPLKEMSTQMIAEMSKLTGGMPIIGAGGISSGQDAYEKIKAGASLVQIYTALVYNGPPVVTKIKRELQHCVMKDGHANVEAAVGKGK
ncbi:unnamed protein product [Phaedon cochleariae]|uniref:Dihydroorotate dehydrogenase (quinone), mitochondrial n=1 Tax=Phaedon cochleariae TaxID=80249 RepID=A0A9N9SHU4_PHACE|nr:unnamed protein product [Phaedon cochleariae]